MVHNFKCSIVVPLLMVAIIMVLLRVMRFCISRETVCPNYLLKDDVTLLKQGKSCKRNIIISTETDDIRLMDLHVKFSFLNTK